MPTASYDIGDVVIISTEVRDQDGTLTAPSTVTLKVRAPDGGITTPTPTNDGVGLYHYDQFVDLDGLWVYRWTTTGTAAASDEREFFVRPRQVDP